MGPCALWLGKDFSFSLVMFGLLAIYLQVSGLLFVFLSYSGYFGLFSLFQHFSISRAIFCVELFSDFFFLGVILDYTDFFHTILEILS